MKRFEMKRRTLLRAAAGTALALPWLEIMQPERSALGQAKPPPKRFIVFMASNGVFPERFWPMLPGQAEHPIDTPPTPHYFSGPSAIDTSDFILGPSMRPLMRHQPDVTFLEGLNSSGSFGHDHWSCGLTGRTNKGGGFDGGGGISLDQEIANHLGSDTKFKSLQLGVLNSGDGGPVSWYGELLPALAENNPQLVFDRVFSEVGAVDTSGIERLRRHRKSVLDAATGQIAEIQGKLGQSDRDKLQNYADSIRELENRLSNAGGGIHCEQPTVTPLTGDRWEYDSHNIPLIMKTQLDLLAMALACDLTRVVTLSFGNSGAAMTLPFLGVTGKFHDALGHALDGDLDAQAKIAKIDEWTAEQFAGLIDRLKAIPEGDGSVFDSTAIVWMNELSKGNSHDADNVPHVLAGSCQGFFKTGRYIRLERLGEGRNQRPRGRWSNDLNVTLLHGMGVDAASFGDPAEYSGPLDILKA